MVATISKKDGVRVGDYGTVFHATVQDENGTAVDLTDASNIFMRFRDPSGITTDKPVVVLDATGGKVYYALEQGFITEAGKWYLQVGVTFAGTSEDYTSNIDDFMVYNALSAP